MRNGVNDTDITPLDLSQRLKDGEDIVLVDVREPHEWNAGHLQNAQHIPMGQLVARLAEIPRDREVVMICRSGARSAHAQHHLLQSGYERVRNLAGGMMRWAREVDPSIAVR